MTARTLANRLLEAEEDLDLPGDLSDYTQSPIPGIEIESEGQHWNVYKKVSKPLPTASRNTTLGTDGYHAFIGEITYDDMADMPKETMTPENIAYWNTHRWFASAGFRDSERQMCASFEAALQFIVAVNAVKTSPVRESDEEPPLDARAEVDRYTAPVGITVQNQGTFEPINRHRGAAGRKFYVELSWDNDHDRPGRIQPLVAFHDLTHITPEWPNGQLVARYEAADLARHTGGLDLYGAEPAWKVDAPAMQQVSQWLRDELETKRGYRLHKDFWNTYEALDPDAPELYVKPEQFTAQPDYEKRESDLRIMLRPYYDEVRINRRPAKYAELFKGLPEYFTWTIHCKRNTNLPLAPKFVEVTNWGVKAYPIDWRKQVKEWFENWALKSGIRLEHFEIFGRLRKNPTFQFNTHLPWKSGTYLRTGQPVKESDEDDLSPERFISDFVDKADWQNELKNDLWNFHPCGVSYLLIGGRGVAYVMAHTYFPPDKDDFAIRFKEFVVNWLTQRRILTVQSVKLYSFAHARPTGGYPEWTVGLSVNSNWPPDLTEHVPAPVKVG